MRVVFTSDTHFPIRKDIVADGDILIVGGDVLYKGTKKEWDAFLPSIAALPHKRKIIVPGNHDLWLEVSAESCVEEAASVGVEILGSTPDKYMTKLENGMSLLALPFVTNLYSWAFNQTEQELYKYMDMLPACDIVVSHAPVQGILSLAATGINARKTGSHYGINAYHSYLQRHQPKYWLSGHVHESYGSAEIDGTKFYNGAMCNEYYEQVNPALIIDL